MIKSISAVDMRQLNSEFLSELCESIEHIADNVKAGNDRNICNECTLNYQLWL